MVPPSQRVNNQRRATISRTSQHRATDNGDISQNGATGRRRNSFIAAQSNGLGSSSNNVPNRGQSNVNRNQGSANNGRNNGQGSESGNFHRRKKNHQT